MHWTFYLTVLEHFPGGIIPQLFSIQVRWEILLLTNIIIIIAVSVIINIIITPIFGSDFINFLSKCWFVKNKTGKKFVRKIDLLERKPILDWLLVGNFVTWNHAYNRVKSCHKETNKHGIEFKKYSEKITYENMFYKHQGSVLRLFR